MPRAAAIAALCLGFVRLAVGLDTGLGADGGQSVQSRRSGFLSIEEIMLHHGGSSPGAANSTRMANSSIVSLVQALKSQVHYELELGRSKPEPKDKRILALILGLNLGWAGVDRCFFGQIMLGVFKGATCGGCCVWAFLDAVFIIINLIQMSDTMDSFYMQATWAKGTVDQALYIWIALLIFNMITARQDRTQCEGQALCRRKLGESVAGKPSAKEAMTLFKLFDADDSGYLDQHELKQALKYLGADPRDLEAYLCLIDKNHDGKVDINEFAEALDKGILKAEA